MRLSPALLLAILALIGAGCVKTVEPTVLPSLPEHESENMVGDVQIKTAEITKGFVLNDFASCKIDIAYPSFTTGQLPAELQLQIEHEIGHFVAAALGSSDEINALSELDALAAETMTACQTEITDEYNDLSAAGEELFTNLQRSVEVVYIVKLNQNGLLSLGLEEYSYTGGAHPNQGSMYLTADLQNGKLLTLGDIIAAEQLRVFLQTADAELLADNRDSLYPESADDFDAVIANTMPMTAEEQLAAYGQLDNFYLTPTSITTYYNAYDIAPYAAGPIYVEIPYADVEEYLRVDGPLAATAE